MLWIKEVEMVESVDDLKSSCSIRGIQGPDFWSTRCEDCFSTQQNHPEYPLQEKVSLEEMKPQKEVRFLRGRQIAYLIYEYFWVAGANDSVEIYTTPFTIAFRNDDIQEFRAKFDGILLSMTKISFDNLESQKWKLWKKRRGQESGTKLREPRTPGDCWQWKTNGQWFKETIAISEPTWMSVHNRTQPQSFSDIRLRGRMREMHREPEILEAETQVVDILDGHARITSKEVAPIHSLTHTILQNACSARPRVVADLGKSARVHIVPLITTLLKKSKNDDKSEVAMLKEIDLHVSVWQPVVNHDESQRDRGDPTRIVTPVMSWNEDLQKRQWSNARHLGCVLRNMPPKSILRKCTDMRKPIQRAKPTKAIARHTKIRDQNPSLGMICPGEPHQRSPKAPKFWGSVSRRDKWQERPWSSGEAGQKCIKYKRDQ